MRSLALALILATLLLAGCSHAVQRSQAEKDAIGTEIGRLAGLAASAQLTTQDLNALDQMLANDADAQEHLEELELMVQYQEYAHAGHALSFIGDQVNTGEHALCPSHELAHYYVFMRHGNEHKAEHALEEAREQLPEWVPKAKEFAKEFPGTQDIDTLASAIAAHLARIDAGDTSATDEEISFLAGEASVCVTG